MIISKSFRRFSTIPAFLLAGGLWIQGAESPMVLLDFEGEAANASPRKELGADPKGIKLTGKAVQPDGLVDACVAPGGSSLGGGGKSLLIFDASRKGARHDGWIVFPPEKDAPITVRFDLRVNEVRSQGDFLIVRLFAEGGAAAGLRLKGDGKEAVLLDGEGKQASRVLVPGRWYRVSLTLPPASAASGDWKLGLEDGTPGGRKEDFIRAKREAPFPGGYFRLAWNTGFGPEAEADLSLDNLRVERATGADFSAPAAASAAPALKECVAMTKSENLRRFPELPWQKRSDWRSVKEDFSVKALGDGKADDAPALQAALDAAGNGTTVYLPPGVYRIATGLELRVPAAGLHGVRLIGHGRATRIVWDGPKDGRMLTIRGLHRSRITGIVWDGRGLAGIGVCHDAIRFETQVTHEMEAFLGFTVSGLQIAPKHKEASAELLYQGCLFEDCDRGLSFYSFNDYDNTVDGCEFIRCAVAIEDVHGNFYARNSRFEASRLADISMQSEHSSSVRRCVSVGSKRFVDHHASVSPMTIESCLVSGWTGADGAVKVGGAPLIVLDTVFQKAPDGGAPIQVALRDQRILSSGNRVEGGGGLVRNPQEARVYEIPAGTAKSPRPSLEESFLGASRPVPGKIFDARRDFGAKGDGKTDDTDAIQKTIDAARAEGKRALAYLPAGKYAVSRTLKMEGKDYSVGGGGFRSLLSWTGDPKGPLLAVQDPQNLVLENLSVGSDDEPREGFDIVQSGGGTGSMSYDMVSVFGLYRKMAERGGLALEGLASGAQVEIRHLQGNLRIRDCARAAILARTSYEGIVTIEGKEKDRGGMLGFLTRLGTKGEYDLVVRDSQSVVMSDFYIEQADNGFLFTGNPGDAPGRIVIQGAKMGTEAGPVTMEGYRGEVFLGHHQYYNKPNPMVFRVSSKEPATLTLLGSMFYGTLPQLTAEGAGKIYLLGNHPKVLSGQEVHDGQGAADTADADAIRVISRAFDELRRLGALDRKISYGR